MTVTPTGPVHLAVIAKAPRAGFVKTRLCPPFTPGQAAELAAAALADTLETVSDAVACGVARQAFVVLDGDPRLIATPPNCVVLAQSEGGLDRRLAMAFEDVYKHVPAPILLIGMDTPQLTVADIAAACGALIRDHVDAVIGLATDGGFWALGLRSPRRATAARDSDVDCVDGTRSTRATPSHGLRVETLSEMCDADDAESAQTVARSNPDRRFARLLEYFTAEVAS